MWLKGIRNEQYALIKNVFMLSKYSFGLRNDRKLKVDSLRMAYREELEMFSYGILWNKRQLSSKRPLSQIFKINPPPPHGYFSETHHLTSYIKSLEVPYGKRYVTLC